MAEKDEKQTLSTPAPRNTVAKSTKEGEFNYTAPRYVIADTCDVTFERLSDDKVIATAEAQLASISQTVDEQEIRGGLGGSLIATITSQKTIEASFRDALFSMDYLEMTQGTQAGDTEVEYLVNMSAKYEGDETSGTLTVSTDEDNKQVMDATEAVYTNAVTGRQSKVAIEKGKITVDDAKAFFDTEAATAMGQEIVVEDGLQVNVLVSVKATGMGISVRSDVFPEKFRLTYRTIAFDPKTMEHVKDIVIQFNEVKPSANFDLGFEMSTPIAPEFTLQVMKPQGCTELGRIVAVDPNKDVVDC